MKEIYIRFTAEQARKYGFLKETDYIPYPHTDLYDCKTPVDTDKLSPAAKWLVDHMISTEFPLAYGPPIKKVTPFTMEQRDEARGVSEEERAAFARAYEGEYTQKPMSAPVRFPILGKQYTPESVIEKAVQDAIRENVAYFLDPKTGDTYELEPIGTGVEAAKIMFSNLRSL